ncbi:MAG: DNA polymerase III subunit alpha, partial [Alistipes sp.]|nr:DNA polymerase III subunit alpha [Alistipes sp.]
SIIKDAVANIKRTKGIDIDIDTIDIDDPKTYKLFCDGGTVGTFQFESPGMQKYLRELKPSTFEDLIAMNALYRPGPMDYIPDFIDRKHGRKPIVYDIDIMEKYLKDTYGITVYQEQVMLLSRLLGGFTRGESDTLRKAMGKKIKSKLDELKPKFIKGGQANGHDPEVLEKIWADWEKFASYAFNKSHATCYSWVAYQTAYLKANYPSEYMAAVLSRNLADIKTITQYITECKQGMGINVLGPDVNESQINFSSNKSGDIRFGMAAIKGVGEAAVRSIIEERENNGPYKNIYDFVERVNFTVINRKCMESIAFAGGFDSIIDFHRSKFFATDTRSANPVPFIEQLMRYGQRVQQERLNAQQSLFGGGTMVDIQPPTTPVAEDWNQLQVLNKERDYIGMFLSAHPLDEYKVIIDHMCKVNLGDLNNLEPLNGQEIALAGIITSVQEMTTKTGRHWGKFTMEDYEGTHEFALFGKDYEQFRPMMYPNYFIFLKGKVQPRPYGDNPELEFKILSMTQLSEVRDTMIKELHVFLTVDDITPTFIADFTAEVQRSKGNAILRTTIRDREAGTVLGLYSKRYKVELSPELIGYLDKNEIKYTLS